MSNKSGRSGKKPSYRNLKYYTVILMEGLNKTVKSQDIISRQRFEPQPSKYIELLLHSKIR